MSGFQIRFASTEIFTPGDQVDALVAMNPAALTTNLVDLINGGILIVNKDAFDEKGMAQASYKTNPLEDNSLDGYQLFPVEMTRLTRLAVEGLGLGQKEADRCRNFYAMGLVFWLYDRSIEPTLRYIDEKFGKMPARGRSQSTGPAGRLQLWRNDRRDGQPLFGTQGRPGAGHLSQHHRQPGLGLGPDRRRRSERLRVVLWQLSDHAGQRYLARAGAAQKLWRAHVSGRRRDRGHHLGHRSRRSAARWA